MTRFEIWFLTLLMVSLWALMPATQLWDWDEAHYARTGIEMFEAGNLILPQFNGELYGHKPPLGFWLMGLATQIFGETEFGARFFSAPAFAVSAILTARTGAALFGQRVGEMAMVIFSTAFLSVYLGAAAMLDAYLVAGCALSVWAMVKIVLAKRVPVFLWLAFTVGGLITLLVKGPVGPVLIGGMALGIWLFLPAEERPSWRGFWALVAGGVLAIAGFMLWFLPANASSGGDLAGEVVGVHMIGRALAPMEGHGGQGLLGFLLFLPIYIPVIPLGLIPWTTFLPGGIRHVFSGMTRVQRVILLAWFLPLFVAFSVVATKLPHYIFPVFPPLAIAIAAWLEQRQDKRGIVGAVVTALFYSLGALGMLWSAVQFSGDLSVAMLLIVALALGMMAVLSLRSRHIGQSVVPLALASLAVMQIFYWGGLREIEPMAKLSRTLGSTIQARVPQQAALYTGTYREPSLSFYSSRPVGNPIHLLHRDEIAGRLAEVPQGYAVFTTQERAFFETAFPERQVEVLALASARNFNQDGVLQEIFLLKWTSNEG